MIVLIPVFVLLVGLLMYVMSARPEIKMMGIILFACGALVTTECLAGVWVKPLPGSSQGSGGR